MRHTHFIILFTTPKRKSYKVYVFSSGWHSELVYSYMSAYMVYVLDTLLIAKMKTSISNSLKTLNVFASKLIDCNWKWATLDHWHPEVEGELNWTQVLAIFLDKTLWIFTRYSEIIKVRRLIFISISEHWFSIHTRFSSRGYIHIICCIRLYSFLLTIRYFLLSFIVFSISSIIRCFFSLIRLKLSLFSSTFLKISVVLFHVLYTFDARQFFFSYSFILDDDLSCQEFSYHVALTPKIPMCRRLKSWALLWNFAASYKLRILCTLALPEIELLPNGNIFDSSLLINLSRTF